VAGDARAFFTKWFFCNLYYNFLARLQHLGNELRAAVLFVPRVPVLLRLMGPSGTPSSALRASSAAHGALEAGARLFGNASARGRGRLAWKRSFCGVMEIFVHFSVKFGVFSRVFSPVLFSMSFFVRSQVFFLMSWRRLRRQHFVMHFVGDGVGFL
jgi:hypothetical protein